MQTTLPARVSGDRGDYDVSVEREKGRLTGGLDGTGIVIRRCTIDSPRETSPNNTHVLDWYRNQLTAVSQTVKTDAFRAVRIDDKLTPECGA